MGWELLSAHQVRSDMLASVRKIKTGILPSSWKQIYRKILNPSSTMISCSTSSAITDELWELSLWVFAEAL
jgi:hypothetical protein